HREPSQSGDRARAAKSGSRGEVPCGEHGNRRQPGCRSGKPDPVRDRPDGQGHQGRWHPRRLSSAPFNERETTMPAKTKTPTQEEMKSRIARFKDLVSTKARHAESRGIPQEVMEMITAKSTFNVMSPADLGGQLSPKPAVIGGDAGVFRLGIATCPAGNGPGLHVHWKTHETFMALTGKWKIVWGDKGEESTILEPFDLIAVPPRVTRQFINISDQDAHL